MRTTMRVSACVGLVAVFVLASGGVALAKTPSASNIWKAVQTLQKQVKTLQAQNMALTTQLASRQASDTALTNSLVSLWVDHLAVKSNKALLLGPYVSVDPNAENGVKGPNIVFSGVNVHIVDGSGKTNDQGSLTGLGNLIVGYDENSLSFARTGSHNLLVGADHGWTSFGGFLAGDGNKVSAPAASVCGGSENVASGNSSSVSGGFKVTASSDLGWATAGYHNP